MKIFKNSQGDTIIEVLIVMAIISLVLGGAYVSANRSLNGTRSSQERAEATKLVEGQLEKLRIAASNPASGVFTNTDFCLNSGLTAVASSDAQCKPQPQGGVQYSLSITRPTSGHNETFTARATWDRAGGGGDENVSIIYRVRQ